MPFVVRNGVRIHYELDGQGPAVFYLPGLGGGVEVARLADWLTVFPDYRMIGIDPRGHGSSDQPREPSAHRVEEYRDDVLAVLDAEHVDRAVGWGISDGSVICAALADAYPDRVSAIVDLDGFDDRDLCEDPLRQGRLDFARTVRARGWGPLLRERMASGGIAGEPVWLASFASGDTEMAALELEEWTRWKGPVSLLPRLTVPILRCLNGRREPDEIARIRGQTRGNVELHVIPGISHQQLCLEPAHTQATVRRFLHRVAPPRPPTSTGPTAR